MKKNSAPVSPQQTRSFLSKNNLRKPIQAAVTADNLKKLPTAEPPRDELPEISHQDIASRAETLKSSKLEWLRVGLKRLTEKDLLKITVENPQYLGKILAVESHNARDMSVDQKKELLTYLHRAWSGLTKFIY